MLRQERIAEQKRIYREIHREELIEYNKNYYKEHKEKLNKEKNRKIICICGSIISFNNFTRHKNSFKHNKIINNNKNEP
jgi:hypothetical protein